MTSIDWQNPSCLTQLEAFADILLPSDGEIVKIWGTEKQLLLFISLALTQAPDSQITWFLIERSRYRSGSARLLEEPFV